jgi:hypothetical protein
MRHLSPTRRPELANEFDNGRGNHARSRGTDVVPLIDMPYFMYVRQYGGWPTAPCGGAVRT